MEKAEKVAAIELPATNDRQHTKLATIDRQRATTTDPAPGFRSVVAPVSVELTVTMSRSCSMAENDDLDRVWAVIERVGVCMLTTRAARGLRARPLEARLDRSSKLIWFVTDLRSTKEPEIGVDHEIGLVFVDKAENVYLSITASAETMRDREVAASIWRATDNMWWDGPDDPNAKLLRVTPRTAELWDGPSNKAVAVFEFFKSQIFGGKPNLGENRKTTIDMR
jgi:general stress protein 26